MLSWILIEAVEKRIFFSIFEQKFIVEGFSQALGQTGLANTDGPFDCDESGCLFQVLQAAAHGLLPAGRRLRRRLLLVLGKPSINSCFCMSSPNW